LGGKRERKCRRDAGFFYHGMYITWGKKKPPFTFHVMSGTWKVANFFQMRTMGYGIAEQQTSDDEADCY
jgi:hypothetical protein